MSKCNIDSVMQYKVRTLVNEITEAASCYNRSASNPSSFNNKLVNNYVSAALAAGIGCRTLPANIISLKSGYELAGLVHDEGLRVLLSAIGELVYVDTPKILKWSNEILANRYDQYINPASSMTALNIKAYLENYVPDSHNFTSMWIERIVALVNEFMVAYYEG